MIIKLIGLNHESKPLSIPGTKSEVDGDDVLLSSPEATKYKAIVAKANYFAQDRSDILFSVKELRRTMSNPTIGCWKALKRLGRYLLSTSRVSLLFDYQEGYKHVDIWTDSDWAGDNKKERKSISG